MDNDRIDEILTNDKSLITNSQWSTLVTTPRQRANHPSTTTHLSKVLRAGNMDTSLTSLTDCRLLLFRPAQSM